MGSPVSCQFCFPGIVTEHLIQYHFVICGLFRTEYSADSVRIEIDENLSRITAQQILDVGKRDAFCPERINEREQWRCGRKWIWNLDFQCGHPIHEWQIEKMYFHLRIAGIGTKLVSEVVKPFCILLYEYAVNLPCFPLGSRALQRPSCRGNGGNRRTRR